MEEKKYELAGEIVKPHGIRGEVGVKSLTSQPDLLFKPRAVFYCGQDENSLRKLEIDSARPFKQGYLLRFTGVADRNEAEKLRGAGLYIAVDQTPGPEEGAWHPQKLVGLVLEDESGETLGRVVKILELAPYDLLEVSREGRKNYYVPLVEEIVREVDLETGRLRVSLPEGLLDL